MPLQIFKQEVQCLITSVKANLELLRSAKSAFLSSDIRKQAACICLLQPIWNTPVNPPRLFYCSSHAAVFSCSTPPLLSLLHHFQITLSICSFAQAYKRSWFPSLPIYFLPYLSSWIFPKWCTTWSLEPSALLWYHTITLKEIGSSLCRQTPNSNTLRAFSLWLHSMVFTPSNSSVISLIFSN